MKKLIVASAPAIVALAWLASAPNVATGLNRSNSGMKPAATGASLMMPVVGVEPSKLRDTFNEGRVGHVHEALDIMASRGTPVVAAVDGTIRKMYTSAQGGLTVYEFDETSTRTYYYAHLDRYAAISEGQHVKQGDLLGYVGSTGNATTPHLHFGIAVLPPGKEWWKGVPVNPYPELTRPDSELPARLSGSD